MTEMQNLEQPILISASHECFGSACISDLCRLRTASSCGQMLIYIVRSMKKGAPRVAQGLSKLAVHVYCRRGSRVDCYRDGSTSHHVFQWRAKLSSHTSLISKSIDDRANAQFNLLKYSILSRLLSQGVC